MRSVGYRADVMHEIMNPPSSSAVSSRITSAVRNTTVNILRNPVYEIRILWVLLISGVVIVFLIIMPLTVTLCCRERPSRYPPSVHSDEFFDSYSSKRHSRRTASFGTVDSFSLKRKSRKSNKKKYKRRRETFAAPKIAKVRDFPSKSSESSSAESTSTGTQSPS